MNRKSGKKSCCLGLVRVVQSCFEHAELQRRPLPHLAAASIQGFVARVPQRKPPVMRHVLRVHDADLLLRLLHAGKLSIAVGQAGNEQVMILSWFSRRRISRSSSRDPSHGRGRSGSCARRTPMPPS